MSRLFSPRETKFYRDQFNETLRVHGIKAKWYSIVKDKDKAYDFYNDIKDMSCFSAPKTVMITYETVPSIKTLQSLGWYVKDEALPYLAYVPVAYRNLTDNKTTTIVPAIDDIVELFPNEVDDVMECSVKYLVKDFVSQGFPNTIYYICKLVPYRENVPEISDEPFPEEESKGEVVIEHTTRPEPKTVDSGYMSDLRALLDSVRDEG